jgi:5'-nucleotidase
MRILVTNDDGVESPGIVALAKALAETEHDVQVVAPSTERSGSSAAVGTLHRLEPMAVTPVSWPELPSVPVLMVDAPPAMIVYAGCLGGFGAAPDLVASGINPGANTGHLVLHSGTVGAALTAAGLGVPGLAVSIGFGRDRNVLRTDPTWHWETAATLAVGALRWVVDPDGGPRVLNLNAPNRPLSEVRGVREATLAPYGTVWAASADSGSGDLLLEFKGNDIEPDPDSDLGLVRAGYASVTPLLAMSRAPVDGAADAITRAVATSP